MKEDLSEWLQILHSETINAYSFFRKLETGILLCKHANTGMVEILSNSWLFMSTIDLNLNLSTFKS